MHTQSMCHHALQLLRPIQYVVSYLGTGGCSLLHPLHSAGTALTFLPLVLVFVTLATGPSLGPWWLLSYNAVSRYVDW
jgi:hypothetical protein